MNRKHTNYRSCAFGCALSVMLALPTPSAAMQPDSVQPVQDSDTDTSLTFPVPQNSPLTRATAQEDDTGLIFGTLGTAVWRIENDTLSIYGGEFYGVGWQADQWPWHPYRDQIKSIRCTSSFKAYGDFSWAFCADTSQSDKQTLYAGTLKSADFSGWDVSKVTNMHAMFAGNAELQTLEISGWNTLNTTDMSDMFKDCYKLSDIDFSKWNTQKVTNFSGMFENCARFDGKSTQNWPMWSARNTSHMFAGCLGLKSLDLNAWDTRSLTDASYMFYGCGFLESLSLNRWNVTRLTSINYMFNGCSQLASLDLSAWKTPSLVSAHDLFNGCRLMSSVFLRDLDISHVDNLSFFFRDCQSLQTIDLSGWNVANPKSLRSMFQGCSSLQSLDLSGWTTSTVDDFARIFSGCTALESLSLAGWSISGTDNANDMLKAFENCTNLKLIACSSPLMPFLRLLPSASSSIWYQNENGPAPISELPAASKTWLLIRESCDLSKSGKISGIAHSYIEEDGLTVHPVPKVSVLGVELNSSLHYQNSWRDAGEQSSVTASGKAPFTGSLTAHYAKVKQNAYTSDLSLAVLEYAPAVVDWTGEAIELNPTVRLGDQTLSKGTDYKITYENNTEPGYATMILTGVGRYCGTLRHSFTIQKSSSDPISLSKATIKLAATQYEWEEGQTIHPEAEVCVGDDVLQEGKDYTVSYVNCSAPGKGTVTFFGRGVYTGSNSISFEIVRKAITPSPISLCTLEDIEDQIWTGEALEPDPVLKGPDGTLLKKNRDYTVAYENSTEPGAATMTITGLTRWEGTLTGFFTILPAPIDTAEFTTLKESYPWTGKAICPNITVMIGSKTLVENTDYTLSYRDNIDPGVASVVISGTGHYSGTLSRGYRIIKDDSSSSESSSSESKDDSQSSSQNPDQPGQPETRSLSEVVVTNINPSYIWTGHPITPTPLLRDQGTLLIKDRDYAVTYANNVNPGLASLYIRGLGNYSGSRHFTFTIQKETPPIVISAAASKIEGLDASYPWTGQPVWPKVTVTVEDKVLKLDEDYTLTYEHNTEPGLASIGIQGKGAYTGSVWKTFRIEKQDTDPEDAKRIEMFRLYNPNSGEHFYTKDSREKSYLVGIGWKDEGTGWIAPSKSDAPVYRLYNPNAGDHHYTLDVHERSTLITLGWKDEGTGWYSADADGVPLYRQYNPNAKGGAHNYTTDKRENDYLASVGWKAEGIGWYGLK